MSSLTFEEFCETLQPIGEVPTVDAETRASIQKAAVAIAALPRITRSSLAHLIEEHPDWVPYLALCCRLSQEKLKSALRHGLKTSGWITLARTKPASIIELLDDRFGLIEEVRGQRRRRWTFADVLVERQSARVNAAGTIGIGRQLEDEVEQIVASLGIPYLMRTKFVGAHRRTAPCDVAIPGGGDAAEIVIAVKSFGSTGSKQSDAAREFEELVAVRAPHQFAYAFCDGIGWLGRQADLRRILALSESRQLDGVFNLSMAAQFRITLEEAARRRGLLPAN